MSKLRHIVLLILVLTAVSAWSQRRISATDPGTYGLSSAQGFSTRDVDSKTDALFGLHASLYSGSHHLIGLSAEGSWSSFASNYKMVSPSPGGAAVGLHFLYEYQYNGLIIQTGLGLNYQRVCVSVADSTLYHPGMIDSWSGIRPRSFTLRHRFTGRKDQSEQAYGQVPIYVGHYFFGSQGIAYLLGGLHVNYMIWSGDTRQKLRGSTAGRYDDYDGIWVQMDNHGFRDKVPIERTGKALKLNFDLMAHIEVGYEYNTQQSVKNYRTKPGDRLDCRLRIGAFMDFGLLDITPQNHTGKLIDIPQATIYDFPTYKMDYVFATQEASRYWMRNMFVGLRFTVLFGFSTKERCILCDPWNH